MLVTHYTVLHRFGRYLPNIFFFFEIEKVEKIKLSYDKFWPYFAIFTLKFGEKWAKFEQNLDELYVPNCIFPEKKTRNQTLPKKWRMKFQKNHEMSKKT